jgi:hypothetical protein
MNSSRAAQMHRLETPDGSADIAGGIHARAI